MGIYKNTHDRLKQTSGLAEPQSLRCLKVRQSLMKNSFYVPFGVEQTKMLWCNTLSESRVALQLLVSDGRSIPPSRFSPAQLKASTVLMEPALCRPRTALRRRYTQSRVGSCLYPWPSAAWSLSKSLFGLWLESRRTWSSQVGKDHKPSKKE